MEPQTIAILKEAKEANVGRPVHSVELAQRNQLSDLRQDVRAGRDNKECINPVFERINLTMSDWGNILETFEDRTIFLTPNWLSFVAKTQKAEPVLAVLQDGGYTLGYFTGLIVKKFGLKVLGSPLPGWTTSYMGFNLSGGVPRRLAVQALTRFAFEDLDCVHLEMMDRNLTVEDINELGLEHRIFSGFEIDLTQSEDRLFAHMRSSCRRCIRKAQKSGVTIEEAHDIEFADEYYSQLQDVFRKQSLVPPYEVGRVRDLFTCLGGTGHLLLLRARDPEGRCIATGIFPAMNGTMYFWGGASWRDAQGYRPNEAIQWYAMKYWKARGIRLYDMGGGGEYKRKFGGYEIRVPWFRKSKYAWIAPMRGLAKQVVNWRQNVMGQAEHVIAKFERI